METQLVFMKKKNEMKIFTYVPDEEDGGVVANNIPVSLLGVELHCKPARVPGLRQSF